MTNETATRDALQTVDSSTFDNAVLQAAGPVTVEFMSYSCAHCRVIEYPLGQVARKVGPRQRIYRVNVALEPMLAARYEVTGTPTLVMFRNGAEIARVEGPPPQEAALLQAVKEPFQVPA